MSALKLKNMHPFNISVCIYIKAHTHTYTHLPRSKLKLYKLNRWECCYCYSCCQSCAATDATWFFCCCCDFVHFVFVSHAYLNLWHCEPQDTCSATQLDDSALTHKCTGAQVIGTFHFFFFANSTPTKPLEATRLGVHSAPLPDS